MPDDLIAELDEALRADAKRYQWLVSRCRITGEHWGGRWSIVIEGPCPERPDCKDSIDAAVDAARSKA
jgi:hypothetical protein